MDGLSDISGGMDHIPSRLRLDRCPLMTKRAMKKMKEASFVRNCYLIVGFLVCSATPSLSASIECRKYSAEDGVTLLETYVLNRAEDGKISGRLKQEKTTYQEGGEKDLNVRYSETAPHDGREGGILGSIVVLGAEADFDELDSKATEENLKKTGKFQVIQRSVHYRFVPQVLFIDWGQVKLYMNYLAYNSTAGARSEVDDRFTCERLD